MPIHTIHIHSRCYLKVVTSRQVSVTAYAFLMYHLLQMLLMILVIHYSSSLLLPLPKVHLLPDDTFIMATILNSTVMECMNPLLLTMNSRNGHMQGSLYAALNGDL